jgi:hypothetical protein
MLHIYCSVFIFAIFKKINYYECGGIIMLKNQLLDVLRKLGNLSLSGDVVQVKVLSDITVSDNENSIIIIGTGLNEYEEEVKNDSFSIDLNSIDYIRSYLDEIELHTNKGLILIEEF